VRYAIKAIAFLKYSFKIKHAAGIPKQLRYLMSGAFPPDKVPEETP